MLCWKWYYQDIEINIGFFLDRTTGREDILLLAKLPMSSRLIGHESGIVEFNVSDIKIHILLFISNGWLFPHYSDQNQRPLHQNFHGNLLKIFLSSLRLHTTQCFVQQLRWHISLSTRLIYLFKCLLLQWLQLQCCWVKDLKSGFYVC